MRWFPLSLTALLALSSVQAVNLPAQAVLSDLPGTPEIMLAQQRLALAQSRVGQDDAWQVTASGDTSLDGSAGKNAWNASATVSAGYRGPRALDDARLTRVLALRRAEFAVQKAGLNEVRRRVNAWHTLRLSVQNTAGAALNLQIAQLTLQTTQARLTEGTANTVQVETARLNVERAELNLRQAQTQQTQARNELNLPGVNAQDITEQTWTPLPAPPTSGPLRREDLLEAALAVQEADAVLQRDVQASQPNLQLSAGFQRGNLSFSGDLDRNLNTNLNATARLNATPTSWNLGLKGSVRLDGAARRIMESAKLTAQQARVTLQSTRTRSERDVQNKKQALSAAQDNLQLAQTQLSAAQDNARIASQRLNLGIISSGDELNARHELSKTVEILYNAQKALDAATLDLWEAVGWLPGGK